MEKAMSSDEKKSKPKVKVVEEEPTDQVKKDVPKPESNKKDPKKVRAGKALAKKNKETREALKRQKEMEAGEEEDNESKSSSWLPEMSFDTIVSLVGIGLVVTDLYLRYRPEKDQTPFGAFPRDPTPPPTPKEAEPQPISRFGME